MIIWAVLAVLIVVADQITKFLVVKNIGPYDMIEVIPDAFEFVYVKNTGAAFSIMENMTWLLGLISVAFSVGLVIFIMKKRPQSKMFLFAASLLFGGAVGNGIDRIFRGFVVDFIKTTFINFPVFNVADISITIGAVIVMILVIKSDSGKEQGEK